MTAKWKRFDISLAPNRLKINNIILSLPLVICLFYMAFSLMLYGSKAPPRGTQMHLSIGNWLNDHAEPGDTVLAGNIGYIGFFCPSCCILDANGLVSPEVIPELLESNGKRNIIIERHSPKYLALENREVTKIGIEFIESNGYTLIESFYYDGSSQSPYLIFEKKS